MITINESDNIPYLSEIDYKEYYLVNENIIYKIIIEKIDNNIIFKCKNNYMISLDINNITDIFKNKFDNINSAYDYIVNIFEEKKINIKNIIIKKEIIINIKIEDEKEIEINLLYNKYTKNIFIDEINRLKNDINKLKDENNILKKEIALLKAYHTNPKKLKILKEITNDSYAEYILDNTFTVFKTINDILYLIYSSQKKSVICYDLNSKNIIKEIKNLHNEYITNIKHYLDKKNERDLIMLICSNNNNIKLWNVNKWECILNLPQVNKEKFLDSACFLNDNDEIFIITCNYNFKGNSESIKVFDINGNKIKEINNSNEETSYIESYYDITDSKNYIITGNKYYVKSYDYNKNELFHTYYENNIGFRKSIIINKDEKITKLIESCQDGYIRIWNFHSGLLLNKIKVCYKWLYGICLWNNKYLFVGCEDSSIKLIDLINGIIIKSLIAHNNKVITIKKINHPQFGECLISQGWKNDQIKLWTTNI